MIMSHWLFNKLKDSINLLVSLSQDNEEEDIFQPTRKDIYHICFLLRQKLPAELVVDILEYASCWLRSSVSIQHEVNVRDNGLAIRPGDTYLSSLPIGECRSNTQNGVALAGLHPVRRVEFTITSRDQGWSSYSEDHGTERGSWTWFEALARDATEKTFQEHRAELGRNPREGEVVLRNIHAGTEWTTRTVTWFAHEDDKKSEWVRGLKRGQIVDLTVWARYPGWLNKIKDAKIDIYTAVIR